MCRDDWHKSTHFSTIIDNSDVRGRLIEFKKIQLPTIDNSDVPGRLEKFSTFYPHH
jgi:hypothetical protein